MIGVEITLIVLTIVKIIGVVKTWFWTRRNDHIFSRYRFYQYCPLYDESSDLKVYLVEWDLYLRNETSRNIISNYVCTRKQPAKSDTQTSSSVYPCTIWGPRWWWWSIRGSCISSWSRLASVTIYIQRNEISFLLVYSMRPIVPCLFRVRRV